MVVEKTWERLCNGHYNRTPDLGKWVKWWNGVTFELNALLD